MNSEHNTDENISWGIHKSYKKLYDALWDKVPLMGEIKGKNYKKLEKFRKASNVIYDIFNNGLMNRGRELRVLKLKVYDLLDNWFKDSNLRRFTDYEDIFLYVSKTIEQYEKSDYAKDYTQSELTCIIEYLENKFEHKVAKIWRVKNNVEIS